MRSVGLGHERDPVVPIAAHHRCSHLSKTINDSARLRAFAYDITSCNYVVGVRIQLYSVFDELVYCTMSMCERARGSV